MEKDTSALQKLLERNLPFHMVISNEVRLTPFGQLTFNVMLKDGVVQLETLNLVKSRRRKYNLDRGGAI